MNPLKHWRTSLKLTQAQLASSLGVSENFIRQLESGTRDLTPALIDVLPQGFPQSFNAWRLRQAQATVASINTNPSTFGVTQHPDLNPHPLVQFFANYGFSNPTAVARSLAIRPRVVSNYLSSGRAELPDDLRYALAGLNQLRELERAIYDFFDLPF